MSATSEPSDAAWRKAARLVNMARLRLAEEDARAREADALGWCAAPESNPDLRSTGRAA